MLDCETRIELNSEESFSPSSKLSAEINCSPRSRILTRREAVFRISQYCEILKTASRLVKIRDLGLQLISAESLDEGEKLSSELSSILVSQSNIQHVSAGDLCQDFYKRMSDETKPTYIKTGFPILDEKLFTPVFL